MSLSSFHPTVRRWFSENLGEPTRPQRRGWPLIREGRHTLIAAPTGSGKTLAAFLSALDTLLREGDDLEDRTRVLYVSPLRALSNDVQKNLRAPLEEMRALDPRLPDVRVLVRTGDTTPGERSSMSRRHPHILVTTPESLYILLASDGGRSMLRSARSVIADEVHAVIGDKRGSHLALSLERLEGLAGPVQRIGLSATQKPLEDVGRFLCGRGRECALVDEGHLRALDIRLEVPPSPLETVCSHEVWGEIYGRAADLIREHRTTLVFASTRKTAERVTAQLARILGKERVACHHSSLSRERRLDAEERLKTGELGALVATASLELGIDIGNVDLVIQLGATHSIATFLQRVGRSGHALDRVPRGRLFPLTRDELVQSLALLRAVRRGELDRTPQPSAPLDILGQQIVAECAAEPVLEDELFERLGRAWPYRDLDRGSFDALLALYTRGRRALIHRDGVNRRLRGTRRARLVAITCGGAIPDKADYRVVVEPEGTFVGTLDEDFAIESSTGDVFQLGNASWRVLKVEQGTVRVADARGAPPNLPFWFGEAPSRTRELSEEVGTVREHGEDIARLHRETGASDEAASQAREYIAAGRKALGAVPTARRVIVERFFDESGGMQLVLHSPFGGRINRAWGLALRKRFCRRFGFELQAAANEDSIVLSLGTHHSFPLEEIWSYLRSASARDVIVQAVLTTPFFTARWRWNVCRALLVERRQKGRRVAPALIRMRTDDLLADAFPQVVACGENLPPGDLAVPLEHPLVRQTIDDCLHEAMDVDGFLEVLRGLESGSIETRAVDTPEPSPFACSILSARPYSFLDDAPLEERRTQAVLNRRTLDPRTADEVGALDPEAVERVRREAWPQPLDAEEVHEALLWMGYVADEEAAPWMGWLEELRAAGRVTCEDGRWFAVEARRDPKEVLRGRLQALGPVFGDDPLLGELEREGFVLRIRLDGRRAWCERRLLARIQRYTLDRLRQDIRPVSAGDFLRFLARWQHLDPETRLEGPLGVAAVASQLAGFEVPASCWEREILPARIVDYVPEWLDQETLSGEVAWGRLWGSTGVSSRNVPLCLFPRAEAPLWLGLAGRAPDGALGASARAIHGVLSARGALFPQELMRAADLLPSFFDQGLEELVARGLATSDSFAALRRLLRRARRRRPGGTLTPGGRWSLFRREELPAPPPEEVAVALLRRYGVLFRKLLERERQPLPWRDLARALRRMELRGDVRGGRFVAGFSGEQFARADAVDLLRRVRKDADSHALVVADVDPLNLRGILTPDERVPAAGRRRVEVV